MQLEEDILDVARVESGSLILTKKNSILMK
jgi:hypothetical protein